MDIDFIAAKLALQEIEKLLIAQGHMNCEQVADEIIEFKNKLEQKYKTKDI